MGMICCLQPIAADEIDGLLADPSTIHNLLEEGYDTGIDLDKSWHAIHFLLSGEAWEREEPACYLVAGGEQIGDEDVGYGPARLLRPYDVKRLDAFLEEIDSAELRRRYNPAAMVAAEIYPDIWDRAEEYEENFQYVIEYYGILRQFVAAAAREGAGVVVSIM